MGKWKFGFESVKMQDTAFFDALTSGVKSLRNSGDFSTAGIKKSFLMQIIKEHTGLNVLLYVKDGWAAHVYPPKITANHAFDRWGGGQSKASKIIDVTKTSLSGTVDVANVKVTGVFSDLASELFIGTDLFKPNGLNDRMIAAIMLHEIGHIFTHFQFISTIALGGLVVEQTVNNIFQTDGYQAKKIQLKAAEEVLGIEPEDTIENWVDTSKENLEVILISRFYRSLTTRSNSSYYDVRNCEQLADTFAVKHGAGLDLARANHLLQKEYGMYGNKNFFVHILRETASLLSVIFLTNYTVSAILLSLRQPKLYDDPKDRIAFIKFHLIDDLKHLPRGDNNTRANIVESISEIDKILKATVSRRDIFTFIHETFTAVGKSASKMQKQQKQLEEMLYNDLYYQSAKLKTLNQE